MSNEIKDSQALGERPAKENAANEVPVRLFASGKRKKPSVDMNKVVGALDILFICLDTLRYDVAVKEETDGKTPVLNRYGKWEKRQAPGNFTYPSHHAMFAGFLPCSFEAKSFYFFPNQSALEKMRRRAFTHFREVPLWRDLK